MYEPVPIADIILSPVMQTVDRALHYSRAIGEHGDASVRCRTTLTNGHTKIDLAEVFGGG